MGGARKGRERVNPAIQEKSENQTSYVAFLSLVELLPTEERKVSFLSP